MFTYSDKKSLIISILTAIVVVAMIVLQFLPCWSYNTETGELYSDAETLAADKAVEGAVTSVSVQGYTWMCTHHRDLTNAFEDAVEAEAKAAGLGRGEYEEFAPTQFVGLPILTLVAGVIAVYFALRRSDNPLLCGLATCISAGANTIMALTQSLLNLGFNKIGMLIVGCVAVLLGLYLVIMAVTMFTKKAKARRAPISPIV